jgi:hypothetical protein
VVLGLATHDTDPAVAQVQQVLRRGVADSDVVDADAGEPGHGRTHHRDRAMQLPQGGQPCSTNTCCAPSTTAVKNHRPSQGTTTPIVPDRPVGRPAALGDGHVPELSRRSPDDLSGRRRDTRQSTEPA